MPLDILALNCTLKSSRAKEPSSTQSLLEQILEAAAPHGAKGRIVRVADLNIKPGVRPDEGRGDDWPALLKRVLAADILVMGTPIWLGQPSSVAKRVLERMDAFLDDTDDKGRMKTFGKVALVAVVGNEDGAHHVGAELFQALNDVGFTLAASGMTYWVGEAMQGKNYVDLMRTPKAVAAATRMAVANACYLAALLKEANYPGTR
jgi:multimeric flavodoxin WrbA